MSQLSFKTLIGAQAKPYIKELANLRIRVFRDFPYLYAGDFDYEQEYLSRYFNSERSIVVLCLDGDQVVGASTGIPLEDDGDDMSQPFKNAGYDISTVFYFGESVLLNQYRGQGAGKKFMEFREQHAKSIPQIRYMAFCGVMREPSHPARPKDYLPLDAFWTRTGFVKQNGLTAQYSWKDLGEDKPTAKPMQFWMKEVGRAK